MDDTLHGRLVSSIDRGLGRASQIDLASASHGAFAEPWLGWLTVCLLRRRVRQRWHQEVVQTRLAGASASDDDDDDHDDADHGAGVPGLPGWTFHFHGIGCCLRGPDGEVVDVDQRDPEAAAIDPWFFARHVESLRGRGGAEAQLWRWVGSQGLLVAACEQLREAGVLASFEGEHLFRLADALERRAEDVAREDLAASATKARWALALGEHAARGEGETATITAAHHAWIEELVAGRGAARAYDALDGAAALLPDEALARCCLRVLSGPIGPGVGKAIRVLEDRALPAEEAVRAVLDRLSPTEDLPAPAYAALAYLLPRAREPSALVPLFRRFSELERAPGFNGHPFLGAYAGLALRFLPELALPLVRRALRSNTPLCVSEIAGLLAAVDQPWCHRELIAALEEPPRTPRDGSSRPYLVEALRRMTGELAAARARKAAEPPVATPEQIGFTFAQVLHANVGPLFEPSLTKALPLAAELRRRLPPHWQG